MTTITNKPGLLESGAALEMRQGLSGPSTPSGRIHEAMRKEARQQETRETLPDLLRELREFRVTKFVGLGVEVEFAPESYAPAAELPDFKPEPPPSPQQDLGLEDPDLYASAEG